MHSPDPAAHPTEVMPRATWRPGTAPSWREVGRRVWRSVAEDRLFLIAGGVTFFSLLALFPALAAFVSVYGMAFDPATIGRHAAELEGLIPGPATDLVQAQLARLAAQPGGALTLGFVLALVLAFWSANGGVKAIIEGLNVAHDRVERRSFLRLNAVALGLTLGAMALAGVLVLALAVLPAVLAVFDLGAAGDLAARVLRWPLLAVAVAVALGVLYRYGPDRPPPPWRWLTWGSGLATLGWLVVSVAFSAYLERVSVADAYGALGTPIAFLLWVWISVIVVILGAEVNGVTERRDAGPERNVR
jgi:membrane protein